MGIVSLPSFGSDPATITAAALDGKVDPLATEFNGSIENSNISASAGITYSKLNLASGIVNADISASAAIAASKVDLGTIAQDINEAKGADVASATTTTIWVTDGNFIHITGTTTITGFGTAPQAGAERTIVFDDALTLTHNATSLILPGGANITTAAGDRAIVRAETTANARVISYIKASGQAVVSTSTSAAAQSDQETATSTTTYVSPGRQQFHPSSPKAWAQFDGTATGTNAPTAGYNVTSVTRNSAGNYTINLTTAFSGTGICVLGSGSSGGSEALIVGMLTAHASAPVIETTNGGGTSQDGALICFAIWGDQS